MILAHIEVLVVISISSNYKASLANISSNNCSIRKYCLLKEGQ